MDQAQVGNFSKYYTFQTAIQLVGMLNGSETQTTSDTYSGKADDWLRRLGVL
jgi:hypothetical protein